MTVKITELPVLDILATGDLIPLVDISSGITKQGTGQQVLDLIKTADIVLATPQVTTSGTSIDFTGIPTSAKRITIMFNQVSTNGTSILRIQLGDTEGIEVTGYAGAVDSTAWSTSSGIDLNTSSVAAGVYSGVITLTLLNSTTHVWVASGLFARTDTAAGFQTTGRKAVSLTLDRVRITTVNGTDTFDAGEINIAYE